MTTGVDQFVRSPLLMPLVAPLKLPPPLVDLPK